MPSNKKRLYIALYPSGNVGNEERRYHWAFLIGPKAEIGETVPGKRYHVKNLSCRWMYEEVAIQNIRATNNLLARILIAKIEKEQRLVDLLRRIPVVQDDSNWRCRTWMESALIEIAKDGKCVGTAQLDWREIEAFTRQYVGHKTANGRYRYSAATAADMLRAKPTWDLLKNKERVS